MTGFALGAALGVALGVAVGTWLPEGDAVGVGIGVGVGGKAEAEGAGDDVDGRGGEAAGDADGTVLPPPQAARPPISMPDSTSREMSNFLIIHGA